jgi:hypothetical protein
MALSTLEPSERRARRPACPHCGRSLNMPCRPSIVKSALSVLAGLVLTLMLGPLAVVAWKSCSDFLSDKFSHLIFYRPLEDWTRY